jgi:hypothetical protein
LTLACDRDRRASRSRVTIKEGYKSKFMLDGYQKRKFAGVSFAAFLLLLALALLFFLPSQAPAQPAVNWNPVSLSETVVAGETNTVAVSFTASENIGDASVRVVPELQSYVQVSPSSFASITKGKTFHFTVTFNPAVTALPGVFDGTIQLRSVNNPKNTVAKPLPVTIQIIAPLSLSAITTFGDLTVNPSAINAGSNTTLSAIIFIPDSNLIPSTLVLQRLDANGNLIATIGILNDDGLVGDIEDGDKQFSFQFTLNEPFPSFLRLRASAAFNGVSEKLNSTERYISVLSPLSDTGPEDLIVTVTNALFKINNVSQLSAYFSDSALARLQRSIDLGGLALLKVFYGPGFQTARLNWKTERSAEFSVKFTLDGLVLSSIVSIEKFPEGWKIVSF